MKTGNMTFDIPIESDRATRRDEMRKIRTVLKFSPSSLRDNGRAWWASFNFTEFRDDPLSVSRDGRWRWWTACSPV